MHKGLASVALLVPWMVWKQHNECIFDGAQPSFAALMTKIKNEASLWARAGALGLRAILPQTWDVHLSFFTLPCNCPPRRLVTNSIFSMQ
jgi:hypothetical protein